MLLFNENAIPSGLGYTVENSLRFRSSASAYLNRTFASAGNRQIWTLSTWIKRGLLGGPRHILTSAGPNHVGGADINQIEFNSSDQFQVYDYPNSEVYRVATTQVFRDPSAWYHIVVEFNSTNATASDRIKIYINGSRVTNFSYAVYPSLNYSTSYINSTRAQVIGQEAARFRYPFDGYMAEFHFIDGQALTPASFGEINASTNSWTAKEYTGTYGTNGFYLPFTDTTSTTTLVADSSGNGNNWTPNNISLTAGVTYDSMIDSPTNGISGTRSVGNYCVLNPIDSGRSITQSNMFYGGSASGIAKATIGVSSGKWYWEFIPDDTDCIVGLCDINLARTASYVGSTANSWGYYRTGTKYTNGAGSSYATSWTVGDTIGVAFDADAGTLTFYKNNISQGIAFSGITGGTYCPANGNSSLDCNGWLNFGQRPFAYTPPTGFKSLNTANLPEPTIKNSSKFMNATTWTGTGATRSITGVGFQPDLVWTKSRSNAETHKLVDAVRGATKALSSETTGDEVTESGITSFNTDGFTIDGATDTGYNTNTYTYVGWNWKKGTTPGFDIVTYTGNGTARTISHSLGIAPNFMIVKARTTASTDQGWPVYHKNNTAAPETDYLLLNSTATTADLDTIWNDTAPTSSVFSVGTNALVNTNNDTYVAYLFAEVPGFSKFGSYTGNGSADGPFVFCGFRPRFVMIKRTNTIGNWPIIDTSRSIFNIAREDMYANLTNAESPTDRIDILANGFKLRTTGGDFNGTSSDTYIFAAFAETPFKYSLAR